MRKLVFKLVAILACVALVVLGIAQGFSYIMVRAVSAVQVVRAWRFF